MENMENQDELGRTCKNCIDVCIRHMNIKYSNIHVKLYKTEN